MPAEDLLERMIRDYGDALLRTCYLYLKDYHLAEDAVQETFIKAMKHYGGFRHRSDEKTWLTRIAINCCKNMMRKNGTGTSGKNSTEPYLLIQRMSSTG